jgi:hypothetical protein
MTTVQGVLTNALSNSESIRYPTMYAPGGDLSKKAAFQGSSLGLGHVHAEVND